MPKLILIISLIAVWNVTGCNRPGQDHSVVKDTSMGSYYLIGTAQADVTGPIAGIATLGYGSPTPIATGIHQRLRARAFTIAEENGNSPVAIAVVDIGLMTHAIKHYVLEALELSLPGVYKYENVLLTATHTHSAPGGIANSKFYNTTAGGVSMENIVAIAKGTAQAIINAHKNRKLGRIGYSQKHINGININRSLIAYNNNPAAERRKYRDNVDKTMEQLNFVSEQGDLMGILNMFAVHGTSLEKNNLLISGDNKGYAAYFSEIENGTRYKKKNDFIAAFANKAAGDVSPNVAGDVDNDGDWDCTKNENFACGASSGYAQARAALDHLTKSQTFIDGSIATRHTFAQMNSQPISRLFNDGNPNAQTCESAIGVSMLAGSAEDGPGFGDEGQTCSKAGFAQKIICRNNPCHGEKIAILNTGKRKSITNILPFQIIKIGNIAIIAVPGEMTTMAGRRVIDTVKSQLTNVQYVSLLSYANGHAGYTTTREEYQMQHYEGGHTVFGEWQLAHMQQTFAGMAHSLRARQPIEKGQTPENLLATLAQADVEKWGDSGAKAGVVYEDVKPVYSRSSAAKVVFYGNNPNYNRIGTFFSVQKRENNRWVDYVQDWDWNTIFSWQKFGETSSLTTILWTIPETTPAGQYRFQYRDRILSHSSEFEVR